MAGPVNTGFNYLKLATDAKSIPAPSQGGPGGDTLELMPAFTAEAPPTPYITVDTPKEKPSVETAYVSHSRVFVVWRAWEMCERCQNAIASGHAILPMGAGDYECPHTMQAEYKALLDKALKGDCIVSHKEVFPTEVSRCVHMEWFEVDPEEARKIKKREELRAKNRVWPPNPEEAFRKD